MAQDRKYCLGGRDRASPKFDCRTQLLSRRISDYHALPLLSTVCSQYQLICAIISSTLLVLLLYSTGRHVHYTIAMYTDLNGEFMILICLSVCISGINECINNPCLNGGTCIDDMNTFVCDCLSGYIGPLCEVSTSMYCHCVTSIE